MTGKHGHRRCSRDPSLYRIPRYFNRLWARPGCNEQHDQGRGRRLGLVLGLHRFRDQHRREVSEPVTLTSLPVAVSMFASPTKRRCWSVRTRPPRRNGASTKVRPWHVLILLIPDSFCLQLDPDDRCPWHWMITMIPAIISIFFLYPATLATIIFGAQPLSLTWVLFCIVYASVVSYTSVP
jgi:hypothetical protein